MYFAKLYSSVLRASKLLAIKLWARKFLASLKKAWQLLRELSGDDAYERYVRHHAIHHAEEPLLNRQEFFKQAQQKKWHGVKRCC